MRDLTLNNVRIDNVRGETFPISLRKVLWQEETEQSKFMSGEKSPIIINNCDAVSITDVTIAGGVHEGPAALLENCNRTQIGEFVLLDETESFTSAIFYLITKNRTFTGLRITNVLAPNVKTAGIILKNTQGSLDNYIISNNVAAVQDTIQGHNSINSKNIR